MLPHYPGTKFVQPVYLTKPLKRSKDEVCSYFSVENHVGGVVVWIHAAPGPHGQQRLTWVHLDDICQVLGAFVIF